jgi:hypothetical protein
MFDGAQKKNLYTLAPRPNTFTTCSSPSQPGRPTFGTLQRNSSCSSSRRRRRRRRSRESVTSQTIFLILERKRIRNYFPLASLLFISSLLFFRQKLLKMDSISDLPLSLSLSHSLSFSLSLTLSLSPSLSLSYTHYPTMGPDSTSRSILIVLKRHT